MAVSTKIITLLCIAILMRDLWSAMMDTLLVNFNVRKEFAKAVLSAPSFSLSDLEDTLMTNSSGKIRIGEKEVTTIMFADDLLTQVQD